jgi:hypothetical protein
MATVNDSKPVDLRVDSVFGEPVVLKPMTVQQGGYRAAIPDVSRVEVIATGIFDTSRGAETGSGPSLHRQATVDSSLSIRMEPVQQCDLKKGDRVYFPDRDETHEVTFVHPDYSGRWDVHMVKVLE